MCGTSNLISLQLSISHSLYVFVTITTITQFSPGTIVTSRRRMMPSGYRTWRTWTDWPSCCPWLHYRNSTNNSPVETEIKQQRPSTSRYSTPSLLGYSWGKKNVSVHPDYRYTSINFDYLVMAGKLKYLNKQYVVKSKLIITREDGCIKFRTLQLLPQGWIYNRLLLLFITVWVVGKRCPISRL